MERHTEEFALLIAQTGPLNGQRWSLRKDLIVGREPSCDVVIPDRQVSRHHARLSLSAEGIFLEDLGSKNGTHHNGKAISGRVLLEDGDVIQIALAQKFIYLSSDSTVPLDAVGGDLVTASASQLQVEEQAVGGRLRLEKRSRRVWIKTSYGRQQPEEVEILPPLSLSQYRLLELLYQNPGRVVSREEIVSAVWGDKQAYEVSEQALDALVRRLRDRISTFDPTHAYIVTVRGHGLRLDNPPA